MSNIITPHQIEFLCGPILNEMTGQDAITDANIMVERVRQIFLFQEDQEYAYEYILETIRGPHK